MEKLRYWSISGGKLNFADYSVFYAPSDLTFSGTSEHPVCQVTFVEAKEIAGSSDIVPFYSTIFDPDCYYDYLVGCQKRKNL